MQYQSKPAKIEAITFEEFVEYGIAHAINIVNGIPWSFEYNGRLITHENNACYLIPTWDGSYKFTPQDMLVTDIKGEIYVLNKEEFAEKYEEYEENATCPNFATEEEREDYMNNHIGLKGRGSPKGLPDTAFFENHNKSIKEKEFEAANKLIGKQQDHWMKVTFEE